MENRKEIREFLVEYAKKWPELALDDLIKLLYQSAFGCGHFAPEEKRALAFLKEETAKTAADSSFPLVEEILGGYARVHLAPFKKTDIALKTLARLFIFTAEKTPGEEEKAWFSSALDLLGELAQEGALPFDAQTVKERIGDYREAGCPAMHHSKAFGAAYHPAYRVVRAEYAKMLGVFARVDALMKEKERVMIAIDGNSGSGKSTLGALLAQVYDGATLFHMDDFFLQMHQRTQERFDTPGGNVDHERFLEEVLLPMRKGETILYRPFDCSRMAIGEGREISPGRLCIVEGSYSLHPALCAAYDVSVLLRIDAKTQAERILERNGPQMLTRFLNEWIPMENRYFEATNIQNRCDLCIGG